MKTRIRVSTVLVVVTTLCGCLTPREHSSGDVKSSNESTAPSVVHREELDRYLTDERLLHMLGVKEVIILESEVDRVVIADKASGKEVGELFYTIQDRWHPKRPNERMEHTPHNAWLIWEI